MVCNVMVQIMIGVVQLAAKSSRNDDDKSDENNQEERLLVLEVETSRNLGA